MSTDSENDSFVDTVRCNKRKRTMESVLQPPPPFKFENNLVNVTSGNLSREWEKWKKAFNIYYDACELSEKVDNVQKNILLHIIGDKCREVSEQFDREAKTVKELLSQFDTFFIPKKNLAVERQKFFKRDQKDLESTEQYVFELNKMAARCEFKDLRDDLVCSRLICGLKDVALSERLLREANITLSKALDICRLAEMSRMQALNIQTENTNHHVHHISQANDNNEQRESEVHWVGRQITRGPAQRQLASSSAARRTPGVRAARPLVPAQYEPAAAPQRRVSHGLHTSTAPRDHVTPMDQRRGQYVNKGCEKCGRVHRKNECPAYGQWCYKCNRGNHYARMCRSARVYVVQDDSTDQDSATS